MASSFLNAAGTIGRVTISERIEAGRDQRPRPFPSGPAPAATRHGRPGARHPVLRHTFGTRLIRDGYDLVLVAELMGHARAETTCGYSLPTADDAKAAINSLPANR